VSFHECYMYGRGFTHGLLGEGLSIEGSHQRSIGQDGVGRKTRGKRVNISYVDVELGTLETMPVQGGKGKEGTIGRTIEVSVNIITWCRQSTLALVVSSIISAHTSLALKCR